MENQGIPKEAQQAGKAPEIDKQKLERYLSKARDDQKLFAGLAAGLGAAIIGAVIWAIVTVLTEHQYGLMAIGVGFLVGYAVRTFGKGIDAIFGMTGGAIALLGCVVGNFLTVLIVVSRQEGIPFLDLLTRVTPGIIAAVLKETFQAMDLLFYAIAVYFGYKYSFKPVTEAELAQLTK